MRILVAPDKFKGSLGGYEVAENIAAGLRDVLPGATFDLVPIADGGEGTAAAICRARGGEWITCAAHDALGRAIEVRYVWLPTNTAVLEMSEAAGGWRISSSERDVLHASTLGVGEMLLEATKRGATEIVIGLGGSATNDGGFGLARSLGFRFLNADNTELKNGLGELLTLAKIVRDPSSGSPLSLPPIIAASDVQNPFLGDHGATRTFGAQKGATPEQLEILEQALTRLAEVVACDLNVDPRNVPGAGAAGGLGFGLISFCGATIRFGFDLVAEVIDLETAVGRADIVVTGEGKLDSQTLGGKAPAGMARLARKMGKPVFAIVGTVMESSLAKTLFDGVFPLARPPMTPEEAMLRTSELLRERGRDLGRLLS